MHYYVAERKTRTRLKPILRITILRNKYTCVIEMILYSRVVLIYMYTCFCMCVRNRRVFESIARPLALVSIIIILLALYNTYYDTVRARLLVGCIKCASVICVSSLHHARTHLAPSVFSQCTVINRRAFSIIAPLDFRFPWNSAFTVHENKVVPPLFPSAPARANRKCPLQCRNEHVQSARKLACAIVTWIFRFGV